MKILYMFHVKKDIFFLEICVIDEKLTIKTWDIKSTKISNDTNN